MLFGILDHELNVLFVDPSLHMLSAPMLTISNTCYLSQLHSGSQLLS